MTFNDDILRVLMEAGENGLRLQKIVLHVYNCHHSLFDSLTVDEVRNHVTRFIRYHSRPHHDMIEKTGRGMYKINPQSSSLRQLRIQFDVQADMTNGEEERTATKDHTPTLFDF